VTVEGHHDGAAAVVSAALDDLDHLLRNHAKATIAQRAILTAAAPAFE
jgi:hypothetical protein